MYVVNLKRKEKVELRSLWASRLIVWGQSEIGLFE